MTRSYISTVTFKNAFVLHGYKSTLPAGTYKVETEEEPLEGVSFPAFKRKQVTLFLQPDQKRPGVEEALSFAPHELDAAQARDAQKTRSQSNGQAPFFMTAAERLDMAAEKALDELPDRPAAGLWVRDMSEPR